MIEGAALDTGRLVVRPFEEDDVNRLVAIFADRDVDLVWTGSFLASLSVIPFTAFVVVVWNALRGA